MIRHKRSMAEVEVEVEVWYALFSGGDKIGLGDPSIVVISNDRNIVTYYGKRYGEYSYIKQITINGGEATSSVDVITPSVDETTYDISGIWYVISVDSTTTYYKYEHMACEVSTDYGNVSFKS